VARQVHRLPLAAKLYIWIISLSGALLLGHLLPRGVTPDFDYLTLILFTLVILVSSLVPVLLPWGANVTISTAINFATVVIFGVGWACWTAAIAEIAAEAMLKKPWYKAVFNAVGAAIWTGLAGLAYQQIAGTRPFNLESIDVALALIAYVAINFVINTLLISIVIGLSEKLRFWQIWQANFRGVLMQYATMIPIGVLIATAYTYSSKWGVLLLAAPLVVIYLSLRNSQDLFQQTMHTIETLADVVDKRDPYTFEHSREVSVYTEKIARRMKLSLQDTMTLTLAARVHDLGKIAIPDNILLKPGKLEPEEREVMQSHSSIGADMVAQLSLYRRGRELILYHHERVDGKGYPMGLQGDQIPLGARIMAVADSFQAMTSDRPYRKALPLSTAIAELERGKGTQFDEKVTNVFLEILKEEEAKQQADQTLNPQTA
jgi:HD-GYP domain-containing protein (c-di-GMP phosphodiesterase class II)